MRHGETRDRSRQGIARMGARHPWVRTHGYRQMSRCDMGRQGIGRDKGLLEWALVTRGLEATAISRCRDATWPFQYCVVDWFRGLKPPATGRCRDSTWDWSRQGVGRNKDFDRLV